VAENDGLTEEERARRAKEFGENDATDFENTYVSLVLVVLGNLGYSTGSLIIVQFRYTL